MLFVLFVRISNSLGHLGKLQFPILIGVEYLQLKKKKEKKKRSQTYSIYPIYYYYVLTAYCVCSAHKNNDSIVRCLFGGK